MVVTKDTPLYGKKLRVMKDGKQVGLCLAVDTVSLEYVQMIPVAWGPDWKPGDEVSQPQPLTHNHDGGFRFVLGKADAVVPLEG